MPVAIVGDRGCGKSVFVSLLTLAADKYAIEEGGGKFRWTQDPMYAQSVGDMQKWLKMRKWPPLTTKGTLSGYYFTFGYQKRLGSRLEKPVKTATRGRVRTPVGMLYNRVNFKIYDIAGEDVTFIKQIVEKRAHESPGMTFANALAASPNPNLKTILDCDVLVFLIDSSRITAKTNSEAYKRMLDYDVVMSTLISAVAEYKGGQPRGAIYPLFIFTKFDAVESGVLESVGLPSQYEEWAKRSQGRSFRHMRDRTEAKRREYAVKLMGKFYGRTLNLIYGGKLKGVDFDDAQYFFSRINTELNEDGIPIPTISPQKGKTGIDVDYSYDEYKAFIKYFQKIAKKMRKEPEDWQGSAIGASG